jgi:hypothetical protein
MNKRNWYTSEFKNQSSVGRVAEAADRQPHFSKVRSCPADGESVKGEISRKSTQHI